MGSISGLCSVAGRSTVIGRDGLSGGSTVIGGGGGNVGSSTFINCLIRSLFAAPRGSPKSNPTPAACASENSGPIILPDSDAVCLVISVMSRGIDVADIFFGGAVGSISAPLSSLKGILR
jgi:hypothetical protein